MILIPLEQQATYLVPSIFAIGYYVHKYCDSGTVRGASKKHKKMCTKHSLFWFGMLGLMCMVLFFTRS